MILKIILEMILKLNNSIEFLSRIPARNREWRSREDQEQLPFIEDQAQEDQEWRQDLAIVLGEGLDIRRSRDRRRDLRIMNRLISRISRPRSH